MAFPFKQMQPGGARARRASRESWTDLLQRLPARRPSAGSLTGARAGNPQAGRPVLFEQLEPRYLLSADLMPWAVDMATDGSDLTLRLDSAFNMLQIVDNSGLSGPQIVEERGLDQVTSVRIAGTGLDDRLVLDFETPFTLAAGISFAGDLGADQLHIKNGLFDRAAYRSQGLGIGVIEQLLGMVGQTIEHSDVEAVDDLSAAGEREISNETGASRTLLLSDDGVAGDGVMQVDDGAGGPALRFASPTGTLDIRAGDFGDTVVLAGLDAAAGTSVSVTGGSGVDTLVGDDAGGSWSVTGADSGAVDGTAFSGIENLTGGAGTDTFFMDGGSVSGMIAGGDGPGADTLVGDDAGATWNVTGADAGAIDGAAAFAGIENLTGGAGDDTFVMAGGTASGTIAGGAGADTLDYSAEAAGVAVDLGAGTATGAGSATDIENVTGGAGADVLTGDGGANVIVGGAGDDVLAGGGGADSFEGGLGSDILVAGDDANTWVITGVNAGTLNEATFVGIETLQGGAGDDTFVFMPGGSITGAVRGGGGTNTLDYSNQIAAIAADLGLGTASLTGGAHDIQNVTGGAGDDTLAGNAGANTLRGGLGADTLAVGAGADNLYGDAGDDSIIGPSGDATWLISGLDIGLVGGAGFFDIENLLGGGGDDTFALADGAEVSGLVDGGGGDNTLDFSAYTTGIVANLAIGVATRIGTVRGIQNVTGGKGRDRLSGDGGANRLEGGDEDDVLVGGGAADILTGGLGFDTVEGPDAGTAWTIDGA
ncbi:MAG: LEPR-XLL domain-containing protein, partial [Alphaproteobacteria bacterium]|nr:LEPR-XLL domain-containing protein [Alphaproteobacteria bacterium]